MIETTFAFCIKCFSIVRGPVYMVFKLLAAATLILCKNQYFSEFLKKTHKLAGGQNYPYKTTVRFTERGI